MIEPDPIDMGLSLRALVVAAAAALVVLQAEGRAQNLAYSLFERYLEPLRMQAAIPGLSVAIVKDGVVAWERGLGHRDLEAQLATQPDTPYPISDLTATFTAALLGRCIDQGTLSIDDPIGTWVPNAADPGATIRQLVQHALPGSASGFKYDRARFSLLARPVEACNDDPFRKAITRQIMDRFGMVSSVPGYDIGTVPAELKSEFDETTLARYQAVLARMAVPYKLDRRTNRNVRSELPPAAVDGANGIIASAADLARFDSALDNYAIVSPALLAEAWRTTVHNGVPSPFGHGWFVQTYEGEKLVWQFGYAPDAYSALILKVPARRLTLILLANSDGLSAPFSLHEGDVTSSLFARTFLRLFL